MKFSRLSVSDCEIMDSCKFEKLCMEWSHLGPSTKGKEII